MKRFAYVAVALVSVPVLASVFWSPSATAQSGSRVAPATFEDQFWSWLKRSNYHNWAPAPGQNGDFYPGESPHGAQLKMFLNRTAISNTKSAAYGSVIVKENFNPEKRLMAVTVMYRAKGFDPENNDWYYVKYNPDGSVATKGDMRLAGKVKGCTVCHSGAEGGDFLFYND